MSKRIIIAVLSIIMAVAVYFLFFRKTTIESPPIISEEKTMEEILQSLTAPGEGEPVSEKILQSLTAPGDGGEVSEEVLQSLTPPK